jgi:hypothetical protein
MEPLTARQVFDPTEPPARGTLPVRPRELIRFYVDYYRAPLAWFGLLVTLAVTAYAGGAVLFILHAFILGELGPAISPMVHWALDSTLGFVGFAPVVALIVPVAAWAATRLAGAVRPLPFALVGGTLFALAAGPGPIVHDLLVGRDTWLANHVTELVGGDVTTAAQHVHGDEVSQVLSIGSQFVVAVPTYVLLMWASLTLVRAALRHRSAVLTARAVLVTTPVE